MRKIYYLILLLHLHPIYAQNKNTEYFSKEEKLDTIKITENKIIGFANTTIAKIKGKTFDKENIGVEETTITFTNLNSSEVKIFETNEDGFFDINIEKGIYSILFSKNRYGKIKIERNEFKEGQIQEININFGSRIKIIECQKIQGKSITRLISKPNKKKKTIL